MSITVFVIVDVWGRLYKLQSAVAPERLAPVCRAAEIHRAAWVTSKNRG